MAAPSTLTLIDVTVRMEQFHNWTPSIGRVRFYSDVVLQGPTEDLFITDLEEVRLFDVNGVVTVPLAATNDPEWIPVGWTWGVEITTNGRLISGSFSLPYNGGPVNLADVLNIAAPVPGVNYVPLAARGAPGGVAALGQDGFVPDSELRYPILVLELNEDPPPGTSSNTLIFRKTS